VIAPVPQASAATSTSATATSATKQSSSRKRYSAAAARARRLRLARARAAAAAKVLQDAQTPRFKTDENGQRVPDVRAEAAIAYNPVTGEVLWQENAQNARSIASITKVMTAVVFLESESDLSRTVVVERSDVRNASVTYLSTGERITTGDLLHLLLVASDNAAARVLARVSPYGSSGFIDRMTEKAIELGLEKTHYADPSGLDARNESSAYDMARLITYAASDERISSIMRKADYRLSTSRKTFTIKNTNKLIGGDVDVRGGKTGFITKAGYCLATLLRLPQGDPVAVVILGAKNTHLRFWETRHVFNWLSEKAQDVLAKQQDEE
jgi:D-alanyl-D-alanine endopeptidase (penicillin-binding protein 7)